MSHPPSHAGPPDTAHGDSHEHVGHVVPLWILISVFAALMFLTWLTVEAVKYDFGKLNLWIALGIAAVKALLVSLIFMHLWWDRPFNNVVFLGSIVFTVLLIAITLIDGRQYYPSAVQPYILTQAAPAAGVAAAP